MKHAYTMAFALILVSCTALRTLAQSPALIRNVDTVTVDVLSSSFPGKGIAMNGTLYFPAENYNGRELWKTNGTAPGTTLVKDIESIFDRADANPRLFVTVGGKLYFFARNGLHLYRYDPATGEMDQPFVGGNESTEPTEVATIGDYIFFASEGYYSDGVELLRFNTTNDALDIFNVTGDNASSFPHNLTVKGDTIFFAADDGTNGTELWMYDHGSESISLVEDINSGSAPSNPSNLIVYNDKLFFSADDGSNGVELWSSDGSDFGTDLYNDINSSGNSNPSNMVVFNNLLFFSADDDVDGYELWMANDAIQSVQQLADINPFGDSHPGNTGYKSIGDTVLYFAASNGSSGQELWRLRSTNINPVLVANISPFGGSSPRDLHSLGDTLIFVANDGSGWELWRSKGTAATTTMIQNIQPSFSPDTVRIVGVLNNRLYFGADDGMKGQELWTTDGTSANTAMLKDINFGSAISSNPQWFTPMGGAMYFAAKTGADYYLGLWKTDGSSGGTVEVKPSSSTTNFIVGFSSAVTLGSNIIFSATTDSTGYEPWKSDGTAAGTVKIANVLPGQTSSNPAQFIVLGPYAYFTANDSVHGTELWKTDGTPGGTMLVKDIAAGTSSSGVSGLTVSNGKLFFTADDDVHGRELWVTDGTAAGTILLQDIRVGSNSSSPNNFYSTGTRLYFTADDSVHGDEVWTSNGTIAGTALFKDINPGMAGSSPNGFAQLGAFVYFSATNATNVAAKLWRTDGTATNTAQFFNVNYPFLFNTVGNRVVFMALPNGSPNGFHIWSTDGTVAGTIEVEDFLPGGEVGYMILDDFPVYNGNVFYWIDDNVSGQELWMTNGTPSGTAKHDIATGPPSSYPRGAKGLNPLIFSADDGTINGREPWRLDVAVPLPADAITLRAEQRAATALLEWTSASSTHRAFELQRSSDGIDFTEIGQLSATAGGSDYHFTDEQPFKGANYFRVKRLLQDGSFDYSNTCRLLFGDKKSAQAFPNPAKDVLNIQTSHSFADGALVIRTMGGQVVLKQSVSGNIIRIPLTMLAPGVYSAEVSEGSYTTKLVFVKQ